MAASPSPYINTPPIQTTTNKRSNYSFNNKVQAASKQAKENNNMIALLKKLLCCGAKSFPSDLPQGYVRVYVGREMPCKLELEANLLNHPLFQNLLHLSVQEFGYSYKGALRIPCELHLFLHLLDLLRSSDPSAHYMDLQRLVSTLSNAAQKKNTWY